MDSFRVVKRLDVFEDAHASLFKVFVPSMPGPFLLHRPEEPFHHGVVVATSCSTHRASNIHRPEDLLKRITGVLTSSVAVMNQCPSLWLAWFNRLPQSRRHDQCCQLIANFPTNDLAAVQTKNHRQIDPASRHRQVSNIRNPFPIISGLTKFHDFSVHAACNRLELSKLPNLQELRISGAKLKRLQISDIPQLHTLVVSWRNPVQDWNVLSEGLLLSGLPELLQLSIWSESPNKAITDKFSNSYASHPKLQRIDLYNSSVSKLTLMELATLTDLRSCNLHGVALSEEQINELKRKSASPNLNVQWRRPRRKRQRTTNARK